MPRFRQYAVYPYEAEFGFSPGFYGPEARVMQVQMPALAGKRRDGLRPTRRLSATQGMIAREIAENYRKKNSHLGLILGIPVGAVFVTGLVYELFLKKKLAASGKGVEGLTDFLIPKGIKGQLDRIAETSGKAVAAGIPIGVGALVIFGAAMVPGDYKWSPYVKMLGIAAGIYVGASGAAYGLAPAPKPPGEIPGAPTVVAGGPVVVTGEHGWKFLGTPRFDLNVRNTTGLPIELAVRGQEWLGSSPGAGSLEVTWPVRNIRVAPAAIVTEPFYLVKEQVQKFPGVRTVQFDVTDMKDGRKVATLVKSFDYSA